MFCPCFARCLNNEACTGLNASLQQSALAGDTYKSAQCAAGYEGNLCGLCRTGYGTVKPFHCKKCLPKVATITLYALAALAMLVAVRVLSALALSDSGQDTAAAKPVDILKPLVLYAQWLLVVCQSMNNVPLPPSLALPLQAVTWFWRSASSSSLGLDCVLPRNASIPVPAQKVLFSLLAPVAMLCAFVWRAVVVVALLVDQASFAHVACGHWAQNQDARLLRELACVHGVYVSANLVACCVLVVCVRFTRRGSARAVCC
jgi:hypothetical protein